MEYILQTLERYGADPAAIRLFDNDRPDLLPYTTLVSARKNPANTTLRPLIGVYEWQDSPLVFLIDGAQVQDSHGTERIRRQVAMRGDAPYLGVVVRPGQLIVYRVSLDNHSLSQTRITIPDEEGAVFPSLANSRPGIDLYPRQRVSDVVLNLLSGSIDRLKVECDVSDDDAISLVGRVLFTRFLGDRELLPDSIIPGGPSQATKLFESAKSAIDTSTWLDETFNGDFLPLSPNLFESLPAGAFATISDIMYRAEDGQLHLEWEEKWANLDFAQIPVGVLSQAYEHFLRKHSPDQQRKEGGFYTPRIIAEMMVSGAFAALRRDNLAASAQILDPAAGAGVFLISGFRQLVAEEWRKTGNRPDTTRLREILYRQISGFDINESALRFAALGLYLASIELDSNPKPVEKLRFQNLRGSVLHLVGQENNTPSQRGLGSLAPKLDPSHLGRYDLVIGNPPWASSTGLEDWPLVLESVAKIATTRRAREVHPKLPNEVLDLPFVWRAMEWAKPLGQIAFALHARLLFQQGEGMTEARCALFAALDVTGIVNGAELRQTEVWPEVSAPFCLLFARNQVPPPGAAFRFVSPTLEDRINRAGSLRVDASNAELVSSEQVVNRPEILKVLFRGSQLDLEILDRLRTRNVRPLKALCQTQPGSPQDRGLITGNGYQKLRSSSRRRIKKGDGLPGVSAQYLWHLPNLTREADQSLLVDTSRLQLFREDRIHDPRTLELFLGPMLLVRKSPPAQVGRIRVRISPNDLAYSENYYGYSAANHPAQQPFVRYLALIVGSKIALWHSLITSGEFGFEREVVEKFVIDNIPVPPFEDLGSAALGTIDALFQALAAEETEAAWENVDQWVATLYGLRKADLQVIEDTLRFRLPFSANRKAAQRPPSTEEVNRFCKTLSSELEPWAKKLDAKLTVAKVDAQMTSPWEFIRVGAGNGSSLATTKEDWPAIVKYADRCAATEIVYPSSAGRCLLLGRLNQARYWSQSQARLVARRIVWEHLDILLETHK